MEPDPTQGEQNVTGPTGSHGKDQGFFATCPRGVERALAGELTGLGAHAVQAARAGVGFSGGLEVAYRACLWSRLASRVLAEVAVFPAPDADALYEGVSRVDWGEHLDARASLAVQASARSPSLRHSGFVALRVKDAIVDQFRARQGVRPDVDRTDPSLRIHVRVHRDRARVAVELGRQSLHRRGYRQQAGAAPVKENLAAAVLALAGWPDSGGPGGALLDPMCGAGTLLIEGAMMQADMAPGLLAGRLSGWRCHQPDLWARLVEDARERADRGRARLGPVVGMDADPRAVEAARLNAQAAGLGEHLHLTVGTLNDLRRPAELENVETGLVVSNPPYGQRLEADGGLGALYGALGRALRSHFGGWNVALLTATPGLIHRTRLTSRSSVSVYNGALPCRVVLLDSPATGPDPGVRAGTGAAEVATAGESPVDMLGNRLRKNLRTMRRWARRADVSCFRVYDADLPEYAVAIDLYEARWAHVQEYAPPSRVPPERAEARRRELLGLLPDVLDIPPSDIHYKLRRRQSGAAQYQRLDARGRFQEVREGKARLLVNFEDYLDTGLFLDHRPVRMLIGELSAGRRFLNLFAYTGSATVHAALGGAASTTTVDMSANYLDWARRNLELNVGVRPCDHLVRADCTMWLKDMARGGEGPEPAYDLMFLDPPTFSNSKRMEGVLDVQRDHVRLIRDCLALLAPGGQLLFSTNFRRFRMDYRVSDGIRLEEITRQTVPRDFQRSPRMHRCWRIDKPG